MDEIRLYIAGQMVIVAATANSNIVNHPNDLADKAIELTDVLIAKLTETETAETVETETETETEI